MLRFFMKYWSPILNVLLFFVLLIWLYIGFDNSSLVTDRIFIYPNYVDILQPMETTTFKLGQSKSKSEMKAVLEAVNKKNQWSGVKAVGDDLILEEMIFHYQGDALQSVSLKVKKSDLDKLVMN